MKILTITKPTLILLFFLSCLSTSYAQLSEVAGVWVNTDADTRGVTKIEIYEKEGLPWMRVFVASYGRPDKDLGYTAFYALGDNVDSKKLPYGFATWDSGFSVWHFTLSLENDKMVVSRFTIFTGEAKRSNYRTDYTFRKAVGDEAALPAKKTNM